MLHLPEQQASLIVDIAVVRWAEEAHFGVEFMTLPISERNQLKQYLAKLRARQPLHP
ncbi:hypothetical protein [Candidatus Nitrospira bockiana]